MENSYIIKFELQHPLIILYIDYDYLSNGKYEYSSSEMTSEIASPKYAH